MKTKYKRFDGSQGIHDDYANYDNETRTAIKWIREKRIDVPFVVTKDNEKVYQLKHNVPEIVLPPDFKVINYNREAGLGPFHKFQYRQLREFLDDYLEVEDILVLGCVSRAFNFYCSDEKLWRRFARRFYKGNLDFSHSWKYSVIQWHNRRVAKRNDRIYVPPLHPPVNRTLPPYWEGMDFELVRAFKHWYRTSCNPTYFELSCPEGLVDRRSVKSMTIEEFQQQYESLHKPVILTDVTEKWKSATEWETNTLISRFGETKFRTGGGFKMKMKRFFNYLKTQFEPQPLYLFDRNYPDNAPEMAAEYSIPDYFAEDLFQIVGEDDRPPYRWILIGPGGSGVPFHTDPRRTSAWNTVLFGAKRWIMYPPGVQPPGVGPDNSDYYDAPTAIKWLLKIYPTLQEHEKPIECIQQAGDTIFIPSGWWHCVYNVGVPINTAVTQNFASSQNFAMVAKDLLADADDEFAKLFKITLQKRKPELYQKFLEIEQEVKRVKQMKTK